MRLRVVAAAALGAVLLAAASGCASSESPAIADATTTSATTASATTASTAAPAAEPVVREVLDELAGPPGAPGSTLTLARYTIAPGAKLAPHVHPGLQMASIESGTLTYTVRSGTAQVRRAGASTSTGVTGPATIELARGDAVTEVGDMVHFGENRTQQPVIILAALLIEAGHQLSEPAPG